MGFNHRQSKCAHDRTSPIFGLRPLLPNGRTSQLLSTCAKLQTVAQRAGSHAAPFQRLTWTFLKNCIVQVQVLVRDAFIGGPFVKRFALCYRSVVGHKTSVCPVLSVTFVHCGQTVGRIKMKLGMLVGLGPGHIVLDGDPKGEVKWSE